MKKNSPIARRTLLTHGGLGLSAGLMAGIARPADARNDPNHGIWSQGYFANKGDVKLAMYRKWLGEKGGWPDKPLPVLFLVHGSSLSSMTFPAANTR
jgi:hypothetical protein